jgi:hypothetical protein
VGRCTPRAAAALTPALTGRGGAGGQADETAAERKLSSESKTVEKLHSKRSLHQQKKDECMRKILELGGTPNGVDAYAAAAVARIPSAVHADARRRLKNLSIDQLMSQLEKTNAKLKKYAHVNKKALDQFVSSTQQARQLCCRRRHLLADSPPNACVVQRDDLLKRKEELDTGRQVRPAARLRRQTRAHLSPPRAQSILELIKHLDDQKDEAITRTFRMVAKQFSKAFAELEHGGKAKLIIETKGTEDGDEEEEDAAAEDDDERGGKGERKEKDTRQFRGININVRPARASTAPAPQHAHRSPCAGLLLGRQAEAEPPVGRPKHGGGTGAHLRHPGSDGCRAHRSAR